MTGRRPAPGGPAPRPALSGRVIDAAGRPVAGAAVMFGADSPEHPDVAQMTNADGRFFYPTLAPGRYTLVVRDEQGRTGGAQAVVSPGGAAEIRIVLTEETP